VLWCVALCYIVLHCVALCCIALQCVAQCAADGYSLMSQDMRTNHVAVCCSVLQRVAACCSMLQYAAVCCIVLHCVAESCRVLHSVAPCAVDGYGPMSQDRCTHVVEV